MNNNYETVIGLEIHLQLKTVSKMFSSAPNNIWQAPANSCVNPVELGLPGALPVPNKTAIEWTQRLGKALNCELPHHSKFDRKNYFYPDLPKGYQISQYDEPLCEEGYLDIQDGDTDKKITIRRIHLEEDTGKSMHKEGNTYLDYNKSGVPLVELVTEPDFSNPDECSVFAKMIQEAVRTLDISNADMEKGNMRLEANISVRKEGQSELPNYRVELKNINSFKFMRDAVNYEVSRQIKAIESGETLEQETRGWDEAKGVSVVQRSKEEAHDYRYFPEPDIPPLEFSTEYFERVLNDIPLMPWEKEAQLIKEGIRKDFAQKIAYDHKKYDCLISLQEKKLLPLGELAKIITNTQDVSLVESLIIKKQEQQQQQNSFGKSQLTEAVEKAISDNPQAVADYRKGKENAVKFMVGQVMRNTRGQAKANLAEKELLRMLKDLS